MLRLAPTHPTAAIFLDETGAISSDRFFAVGCLKVVEPLHLTRRVQHLRDRHHWYTELHWYDITKKFVPLYRELIDAVCAVPDVRFACLVADRKDYDPVAVHGTQWRAYEAMARELLEMVIEPDEIVSVIADNYSTPATVNFEIDVRAAVNQRLGRLAIATMCRLDSKAADLLQVADMLTSAVTFEFRQAANLAKGDSPKGVLSRHLRGALGVDTFLDRPVQNAIVDVRLLEAGRDV